MASLYVPEDDKTHYFFGDQMLMNRPSAKMQAARFATLLYRGNWAPLHVEAIRAELRGKNLACFCPLDQPCHADVLLELANKDES